MDILIPRGNYPESYSTWKINWAVYLVNNYYTMLELKLFCCIHLSRLFRQQTSPNSTVLWRHHEHCLWLLPPSTPSMPAPPQFHVRGPGQGLTQAVRCLQTWAPLHWLGQDDGHSRELRSWPFYKETWKGGCRHQFGEVVDKRVGYLPQNKTWWVSREIVHGL